MDVEECKLFTKINSNNFPGKLWRLVNEPHYNSIQWDWRGEGITIDQELFEAELLLPPRGIKTPYDQFKITSFGSFIRQLNMYGFRKLVYKPDASSQPDRNIEAGNRSLHYFCNSFFRKEHPELLVNIKRMASNKAKKTAGFKVFTRGPKQCQQLASNPSREQRMSGNHGVLPIQQMHNFSENISQYFYTGPVCQRHAASTIPVYNMMLPSSQGPYEGCLAVPSFPEKPVYLPVMQQYPTDVAYTLQSTATSLHVQQNNSFIMESVHKFGGFVSSTMQYPNVYNPTAVFQGYQLPYMEPVPSFSDSVFSSYTPYSYFQRLPVQTTYLIECFQPNMPHTFYDDCKGEQTNFSTSNEILPVGTVDLLVCDVPSAVPITNVKNMAPTKEMEDLNSLHDLTVRVDKL
ncbi:heat shock factor protein 5 isoform X1 [Pyxicephalus adspersus]|uniref:HSF-type DNA-binding domain-containing protein n=1 Tax=Pyxicephalus adspersus TaxID=30357 RepID=A0AAV3B3P5_PYXAD|nr:TPA: hypothetical protein GDO54_001755 [Pyxicephalus adspersus]